MAYSVLVLQKDQDENSRIDAPIGYALDVLLYPLIVSIFISVMYQILSIIGVLDPQILVGKVIFWLSSWVLLYFGNAWAAIDRKDSRKMIVRMGVLGILTAGLSSVLLSFFYNRMFLKAKYSEGFEIIGIKSPINGVLAEMNELNPVSYDVLSKKYFIWLSFFGISYKKEFKNLELAFNFVKEHSKKCSGLAYILKPLSLEQNHFRTPAAYQLPMDNWFNQLKQS